MKHLPTVKQLRYLVALDKTRHFGKAAEDCFVTQSAFSVAIKELETILNVSLVDRSNRNVTMTLIGKKIVGQARLALFDIEGIVDVANQSQSPLSGELRMGVIPTIAPFLLPSVLPKIRRKFPDLELYLKEDQTHRIHRSLLEGDLDILLLALPYDLSNTQTYPLFDDHFYLAYHKDTSFIDPDNYKTSRLDSEYILLLEDGHCLRDHALSACKIRRKDRVSKIAASSLHTLVQMVDNDLGITFVPEMALKNGILKFTQVQSRKMPGLGYRTIGLAWRKNTQRAKEFKLLGNEIKETVR